MKSNGKIIWEESQKKTKDCLSELDEIRDKAEQLLAKQQCLTLKDLAVDGHDVVATEVELGSEVSWVLTRLL